MTRCSIVIPVRNRAALTERCLQDLLATVAGDACTEIAVVDDGSRDETASVLERVADRITVVKNAETVGFAASCNRGARACGGDYLVFLNNDVLGRPGWLDALVRYADATPEIGAVGSKLLYANETIQHAGIVICHDSLPRHVYRGFASTHPAVNVSRQYQAVTAACMLVPRRVFEETGGFDTSFVNGFEDVDFCLRLAALDLDVHYCHESVLVHLEAATRGDDPEAFVKNAKGYLERWADRVHPDDLTTYVRDGLIEIELSDVYPLQMTVSPLLATVEVDAVMPQVFTLLGIRSRQVFDLLKENTVLRSRLGDATELPVFSEELRTADEPEPDLADTNAS